LVFFGDGIDTVDFVVDEDENTGGWGEFGVVAGGGEGFLGAVDYDVVGGEGVERKCGVDGHLGVGTDGSVGVEVEGVGTIYVEGGVEVFGFFTRLGYVEEVHSCDC